MRIVRLSLLLIGFLGLWQGIIWCMHPPDFILPSPLSTLGTFAAQPAILWHAFLTTLTETVVGFVFGILFGTATAIILMLAPKCNPWILPLLLISQAIPTFAIAPVLVLWLGFGITSKIVMIIIMIFFPITSAFYDGLRNTPYALVDMARMHALSNWQVLWQLRIPAALLKLSSGIKVAAAIAPLGAIIGEWVGSSAGLGYLMLTANARLETPVVFACIFILIIMTLSLYFIVDQCAKKLIFWEPYT